MSHVLSAVIHAARDISDVAFIVELPVCITTSPSWDALQVMSSDTAVFKKIPKLHWLLYVCKEPCSDGSICNKGVV